MTSKRKPADWSESLETLASFYDDSNAETASRHACVKRIVRRSGRLRNLLDWGRKYLPEHFARPPSIMHRWLADRLGAARLARGTKLNVLALRGSAKSTLNTLAMPLLAAVEGWEPYIWIVSDTKHQACAHLENVKTELVENRLLADDYPAAAGRGRVWRGNMIVLGNGVTIEAFGTGQRIRGRRRRQHRPTLIVCDDGHIRSALQRDNSRDWFHGTLLNAGTPTTNFVNLATALHRDALAMELHRTPGWSSRLFKAIARWPKNMSLWREWEAIYTDVAKPDYQTIARAFYERNRQAMDAGAVLLWPTVDDLYTLMKLRIESGRTAFEREKQNSPIDPDRCEWPEEYFDESIWFDDWPSELVASAPTDLT